jgi:hypothetical protein
MFYTDKLLPFEVPKIRSFDLDEPDDLTVVRALIESGILEL